MVWLFDTEGIGYSIGTGLRQDEFSSADIEWSPDSSRLLIIIEPNAWVFYLK